MPPLATPRDDEGVDAPNMLGNGSFEEPEADAARWQHVRQARRVADTTAPDGKYVLTFSNSTPGRDAQAQQTLRWRGPMASAVSLRGWVRVSGAVPGQVTAQRPFVRMVLYDGSRRPLTEAVAGPWQGDSDWQSFDIVSRVPLRARSATVWIGLAGGTGEATFDGLALTPADFNPSVLPGLPQP